MGLDQYLSVRKYISRNEDLFDRAVSASGIAELVEQDGYTGIFIEVPALYWRKFNALHNHIVEVWGNGRDECQPIEIPVDGLRTIRDKMQIILENKDMAEEILPTKDGFFFGPIEYDDWYFENVENTRDELTQFLEKVDKLEDDVYPVYQASW